MPRRNFISIRTSFRALSYRNYRLFFTGQAISLIGTWMTRLASSWLVYRLTNDAFLLGVVNFASLIPTFLLAPVAGVIVDNTKNLQRLIIYTQIAGLVQSAGLAVVAMEHWSTPTTINALIILNIMQGLINAFDMPGRQAFLPQMIHNKTDLANGIALNSTLFNTARLIGPALAGILIGLVGEFWCFTIDSISYIGVVWALYAMKIDHSSRVVPAKQSITKSLIEGFQYSYRSLPIRSVLILVALLSFAGMPYTVLLPVYAKEILKGDASTLGLLTSAVGCGAVVGALLLARRQSVEGIGKVIIWAGITFTVALLSFAYSPFLWLSMPLLLCAGFGMLVQSASCNTILQTIVDSDKRGRVMSLYSTAFMGMMPFGSLAAGYYSKKIGAPNTLACCAGICALSTGFFAWRLKQIHVAATKTQPSEP